MKLKVPDNLIGIELIDLIKLFYDDYVASQDDINDLESINNLEARIKTCTRTSVNDYLFNFIKYVGSSSGSIMSDDDVSYLVTLVQALKGTPYLLTILDIFPDLNITSWKYNTTGSDYDLELNIASITTKQVKFIIEQLRKALNSLLIINKLTINIDTINSLVSSEGESIISKPLVELNSSYKFSVSEINEIST